MTGSAAHFVTTLQANPWYNLAITLLAILSIGLLGYELVFTEHSAIISTLHHIDLMIAWLFLTDFFVGLWLNRAQTRQEYWKRNWLNLISSIPITSEITQALRILRVWRAARIVRVSANFWFARTRLHDSQQHTTRVR